MIGPQSRLNYIVAAEDGRFGTAQTAASDVLKNLFDLRLSSSEPGKATSSSAARYCFLGENKIVLRRHLNKSRSILKVDTMEVPFDLQSARGFEEPLL